LDDALKDYNFVKSTLLERGLILTRIESRRRIKNKLKGAGIHPHLRESLLLASLDYKAGGGVVESQGDEKCFDFVDTVEKWIGRGNYIFAKTYKGVIKVEARLYQHDDAYYYGLGDNFNQAFMDLKIKMDASYPQSKK